MLVKKKSNPLSKLKFLIIPVVILAGLIYFLYSPVFKIQKIEINGSGVSEIQINEYLGEKTIGANMLFWQPANDAFRENLEAPLFTIQKKYFSRSIVINIIERDKKLVWCYEPVGDCFWADQNGILFDPAPRSSGNLLKIIHDYTQYGEGSKAGIGQVILPSDFKRNLFSILSIVDKLNLSAKELRIENIKFREFIVDLINGPEIVFSLSFDPGFTEAAIAQFQKSDTWKNIRKINLTVEGRAYASF